MPYQTKLVFEGHLSNIAENTYIGAMNDETGQVNTALDYVKDGAVDTIPEMAKRWRSRGQSWMIVGDVCHNILQSEADTDQTVVQLR